jgi:tetratricopeptide (TPR) repeat protein/S1-C subfamily serine protease
MKYSLLLGSTIALVTFADTSLAKNPAEIQTIAKSVTVEIRLKTIDQVGSGVIIHRQGDLYTVVTNRHVVCGNIKCVQLAEQEKYQIGMADGQKYQVAAPAIKLLGNDLDLAIIQFRSSRKYQVVSLADSGKVKVDDALYTAGFPFEKSGFSFNGGDAIAVVNKRLTGDNGGYTIVYNAATLPGMSGGGVFNANGQLVAIHGIGIRFKENTDLDDRTRVDAKVGLNRGIPVRWLVQSLKELGIDVGIKQKVSEIRATAAVKPTTADEHFIIGYNLNVNPGNNILIGKRQAIQEFTKAIQLNPRYGMAYFARAHVYYQLQEFQKSLSDYNQSIAIHPNSPEAYNNRGNLKSDFQDLSGALVDYNQAIKLNPQYAEAYNNRGNSKSRLEDKQGAILDYNKAIKLNPRYVLAYNNRGNLKASLNNYQDAIIDYDQAILLNNKTAYIYVNRGAAKSNLRDQQGAMADFNMAIDLNPKLAYAYGIRGRLKYDLGDFKAAMTDYNQAIKLNPKDYIAYYNRGNLKYKLKDLQGAISDYSKLIKLKPNNNLIATAYMNRGVVKQDLQDLIGATADYKQALNFDPKNAKIYFNQGNLNFTKKNPSAAISDYNQAINLDPKYAEAYGLRGFVKAYALNDRAGGIQDLRRAVELFREQGSLQNHSGTVEVLRKLESGQ